MLALYSKAHSMTRSSFQHMVLNGTNCPFCGGKELRAFSARAHDELPDTVNIIECIDCEAGWQWPLKRTALQSEEIFEKAYTSVKPDTYFDVDRRNAVARVQCQFVLDHMHCAGDLLDIGCGDGTFARQMAHAGWKVVGVDPAIQSPSSEEYGKGGFNLAARSISEISPNKQFDLITLWDVVEHVVDPSMLLAEAVKHLKTGGRLIVETGNYQCQARIEGAEEWWNYQLDHRWYFAPPQLHVLLKDIGLSNIVLADKVLRPWWKGHADIQPTPLHSRVKAMICNPNRILYYYRMHEQTAKAAKRWKSWGGIEIMTMTGVLEN